MVFWVALAMYNRRGHIDLLAKYSFQAAYMQSQSWRYLLLILFCALTITGCEQPTTSLSKGMKMQEAVDALKARSVGSAEVDLQKIHADKKHQAYSLPGDRRVVLFGDQSVDEILVIEKPAKPNKKDDGMFVQMLTF